MIFVSACFTTIACSLLLFLQAERFFAIVERAHSCNKDTKQGSEKGLGTFTAVKECCVMPLLLHLHFGIRKKKNSLAVTLLYACICVCKRVCGRGEMVDEDVGFLFSRKASDSRKRDSDEKSLHHLLSFSRITYVGGKAVYVTSLTFSSGIRGTLTNTMHSDQNGNFIWR